MKLKDLTLANAQLKQALAKMLPKELHYEDNAGTSETLDEAVSKPFKASLLWKNRTDLIRDWPEVLDTELLHLCWLVEEKVKLESGCMPTEWYIQLRLASQDNEERATWQQRTIALAKVLNIEIV